MRKSRGSRSGSAAKRSQVVGVTELHAQLLEQGLIALLSVAPDVLFKMAHQVGGYPIVVEQRIMNVKQERDLRHAGHLPFS